MSRCMRFANATNLAGTLMYGVVLKTAAVAVLCKSRDKLEKNMLKCTKLNIGVAQRCVSVALPLLCKLCRVQLLDIVHALSKVLG